MKHKLLSTCLLALLFFAFVFAPQVQAVSFVTTDICIQGSMTTSLVSRDQRYLLYADTKGFLRRYEFSTKETVDLCRFFYPVKKMFFSQDGLEVVVVLSADTVVSSPDLRGIEVLLMEHFISVIPYSMIEKSNIVSKDCFCFFHTRDQDHDYSNVLDVSLSPDRQILVLSHTQGLVFVSRKGEIKCFQDLSYVKKVLWLPNFEGDYVLVFSRFNSNIVTIALLQKDLENLFRLHKLRVSKDTIIHDMWVGKGSTSSDFTLFVRGTDKLISLRGTAEQVMTDDESYSYSHEQGFKQDVNGFLIPHSSLSTFFDIYPCEPNKLYIRGYKGYELRNFIYLKAPINARNIFLNSCTTERQGSDIAMYMPYRVSDNVVRINLIIDERA